ncbi:hypothetical protein SARC_03982 [Sphaeroforma arctica JP610]|uniref:Uncharacterized protein n=1 Tax=Sphaeroforma arctica JP610 TaxID=667725 RepID=A0A0L0G4S6_9EUKA|nr:hypothetical protein SARC_03982 [Sphaeroforma arctica JP610]KNC83806.1 hypothetical protein SARC_03982 [Sphaeroforma arctica JP610]|eukprot:XP_014157708.1 hypothetical protein SARC_03982 [Sphaeroforma arctica JP610]
MKAEKDNETWINRYIFRSGAKVENVYRKTYETLNNPEPVGNPQIEAFYNRRKSAIKDIAKIIQDLRTLQLDSITIELWKRAASITKATKRCTVDKKSSVLPFAIYSTQQAIKALERPTSSELLEEASELFKYLKGHYEIPKDVYELILVQREDIKDVLYASRADPSLQELWAKITAMTKRANTTSTSRPKKLLRAKTILYHAVNFQEQRPQTWKEKIWDANPPVYNSDEYEVSSPDEFTSDSNMVSEQNAQVDTQGIHNDLQAIHADLSDLSDLTARINNAHDMIIEIHSFF